MADSSSQEANDFAREAETATPSFFREFGDFLRQNKKWWLLPPVIIFVLFGVLVVFSTASTVSPFVYMLF